MEQVFPQKIFRQKREYLECFPFEWKNRFSWWETKWNRSFRRKFFEKRNTFRGIPLFSFSPKLPENHCTIYSITLVPCFLAKIRDFAREWRPPSCLSFQYAVFILNKRNVIEDTDQRKSNHTIWPLNLLISYASTLSVTSRATLETLLHVTLNRSAISCVFSSFAMHHKKIETCFRAPIALFSVETSDSRKYVCVRRLITCLPNGFPTGSCLSCPLSSFLTEYRRVLFVRNTHDTDSNFSGQLMLPWKSLQKRAVEQFLEVLSMLTLIQSLKV